MILCIYGVIILIAESIFAVYVLVSKVESDYGVRIVWDCTIAWNNLDSCLLLLNNGCWIHSDLVHLKFNR